MIYTRFRNVSLELRTNNGYYRLSFVDATSFDREICQTYYNQNYYLCKQNLCLTLTSNTDQHTHRFILAK